MVRILLVCLTHKGTGTNIMVLMCFMAGQLPGAHSFMCFMDRCSMATCLAEYPHCHARLSMHAPEPNKTIEDYLMHTMAIKLELLKFN